MRHPNVAPRADNPHLLCPEPAELEGGGSFGAPSWHTFSMEGVRRPVGGAL